MLDPGISISISISIRAITSVIIPRTSTNPYHSAGNGNCRRHIAHDAIRCCFELKCSEDIIMFQFYVI
jgi:hypothetical protein